MPDNAPSEYNDRSILWNEVERIEKNKNAQLAREMEIALPIELSAGQNILLVREYCQKHFVSAGMCADICIHVPPQRNADAEGGFCEAKVVNKNDGNPHAHIMLTMRPFENDGSWGAKSKKDYILDENGEKILLKSGEYKSQKINTVDWNEQTKAEEWRNGWADMVNQYLSQNNVDIKIDHRSYERQGIVQIPTIHLGVAASGMERRGIATERGNINRAIEVTNKELRQVRARIRKAKDWLYAQPITNAPTFMSMMTNISNSKNLDSRWKKITDLKTQASVLVFLQNNEIVSMEQLVDKVTTMNEEFYEVSNKIKDVDKRLGTLAHHLAQYENYKTHKTVYDKYKQLDPKKQDAFYEKYSEKIELFKDARQYLNAVMNGKTSVPIKSWQEEQKKLTAHRFSLCEKFYGLKEEIRNAEVINRNLEETLKINYEIEPPSKNKYIEL